MHGRDIIKQTLNNLPNQAGVYQMFDQDNVIIYIGKAKNLRKRVISYTKLDLPIRTARMVHLVRHIEYITTATEAEALLLEANLIRKLQPRYNILLKDDKSFPYIKLRQDHAYPQILKYRGKKLEQGKFFGPFASVSQLDTALKDIHKIFLLRSCSDNYFSNRTRPCLQYQIKRCSAPCCGKISQEEYANSIKQTEQFLSGKTAEVQKQLQIEMDQYSNELEYEKAAQIRDRIQALSYIQMKYHHSNEIENGDIIVLTEQNNIFCIYASIIRGGKNYGGKAYFPAHAQNANAQEVISSFLGQFYQTHPAPKHILLNIGLDEDLIHNLQEALHSLYGISPKFLFPKRGNKYQLLEHALDNAKASLKSKQREYAKFRDIEIELQKLFDIPNSIERIEIYDNSHIMGRHALGAMVVAGPDGFLKSEYRSFNIKSELADTGGDDYLMLEETLTRRLQRLAKEPYRRADLIIIDGGKGHLMRADKVMKRLSITIPLVAMAKGVERNSGRETFHMVGRDPFTLPKDDTTMRYLQILRDEAHNYAIETHRRKRNKDITFSSLETLPNIGSKRNKLLLQHFGSLQAIKNAKIDDLCRIAGINKTLAQQILEYLQ